MGKSLNINTAIMFLVSLAASYVTASMIISAQNHSAYGWGFILGRATIGVFLPFIIVFLPVSLFRRGKPKFTRGPIISWWVLFIVLTAMAMFGSTLPPVHD